MPLQDLQHGPATVTRIEVSADKRDRSGEVGCADRRYPLEREDEWPVRFGYFPHHPGPGRKP